jgi:hypothetical protein
MATQHPPVTVEGLPAKPRDAYNRWRSCGISKNIRSDFIFANVRGNPPSYLRRRVISAVSFDRPYEIFPLKVKSPESIGAASFISEEQWKTQVVAEVEKIEAAANERWTRLTKKIISSAPNVPVSSRFSYYTTVNERRCSDDISKRLGLRDALCVFICIGPFFFFLFYYVLCQIVFAFLSLFCDLPLGRWSSDPATPQEVEWYNRLMNDNPDLDTFAIDDMVKEELDKLVARLRRQFPAYKGLRLYTGAETFVAGSAGDYTLDLFLIVFDESEPVVAAANMV